MRLVHQIAAAALTLSLNLMPGCAGEPLTGPPELRLGRSECGECGMIISEDRCSCGVLTESDGRRSYMLYDDIGCMLDDERDGLGDAKVIERYVHDHPTRRWVRAESATYLLAADHKALPTPMGSGLIAFAERAEAEKALRTHPGRLLAFSEVGEARREWMEGRFGKPRPRDD